MIEVPLYGGSVGLRLGAGALPVAVCALKGIV